MLRDLTCLAVMAAAILSSAPLRAEDTAPPCRSRLVKVELAKRADVLRFDAAGGSLCMQARPAAVQLEVRRNTIAAVLAVLSTAYRISYRSAIALDEARDGIYAGSLRHVISRLLDGYDYVITQDSSNLDIIVVDRKGEQAVPAPAVIEVSENVVRPVPHGSRTH
jgi:hypothetical protein